MRIFSDLYLQNSNNLARMFCPSVIRRPIDQVLFLFFFLIFANNLFFGLKKLTPTQQIDLKDMAKVQKDLEAETYLVGKFKYFFFSFFFFLIKRI